jgi:hypothetical protein
MAIFLSAARSGQLVEELLAGGYAEDTPVVVAYKATWPDELILHTTIGELVEEVKQHKLWRHTLFLVGRALRGGGTRSHLYNAGHFHTYRKADPTARRALRASRTGEAETDDGAGEPRGRTGWPLHTSRSGWVAARIANGWSPTQRGKPADALAGASQPASVAAWSAVQGWQDTARSAGRPTTRTRPEAKPPAPDQGTLELGDEPKVVALAAVPTAEPEIEPATEPAIETAAGAAVEAAVAAVAEPVVEVAEVAEVAEVVAGVSEPEDVVEVKPQAQPRARAKSSGRAAPRKQTGRKPAGKGAQNRRSGNGNSGNSGNSGSGNSGKAG